MEFAIVLLVEYKKKGDADKENVTIKTLGKIGAMKDKRDAQTAYLMT
jgi:hypothetical protein